MNETVQAGVLQDTIAKAGGELIKDIQVFDVYQGDRLTVGKKSIAFSLFYQDPERTLMDEEVEASYQAILEAVANEHQAELRA
ncbi:phenylalanyl-tRNA synthetase beta chain [Gracilibacillus boraciitolerans JCM 21714]|uniref:Phenylalanine--tRNA ligase beta subunit n=1 Tax=Gracilibacillus boraciitolerans JCM 21714 TaxID=1298598 RepID=W4VIS0_9BACI|nr:phenylalanyl-tRNA synthetase beta chain [Gracilibacillus boraciitolerans JCM 21714]